jgi:hypothetical protein
MNKQRLESYEFRETESWATHTFGECATRERNETDVAGRGSITQDGCQ